MYAIRERKIKDIERTNTQRYKIVKCDKKNH